MPDSSSSANPVITPGPMTLSTLLRTEARGCADALADRATLVPRLREAAGWALRVRFLKGLITAISSSCFSIPGIAWHSMSFAAAFFESQEHVIGLWQCACRHTVLDLTIYIMSQGNRREVNTRLFRIVDASGRRGSVSGQGFTGSGTLLACRPSHSCCSVPVLAWTRRGCQPAPDQRLLPGGRVRQRRLSLQRTHC